MKIIGSIRNISTASWRDAGRMATQSAAAAVLTYSAMRWIQVDQAFVAILSAVLIVQPSLGGTMGAASKRLIATIVGSLIALVCLIGLPSGYGTVFALAITMFVINGIATLKPEWQYGAVAAVALSLGAESEAVQTALDRSIGIAVGATIGILCSLVIVPDTATKRLERHIRRLLHALSACLEEAMEKTRLSEPDQDIAHSRAYHAALADAREAASAQRFGSDERLEQRVELANHLYNSIVMVMRASASTGAMSGGQGLGDPVDQFLNAAQDLIDGMAETNAVDRDALSRIDAAMDDMPGVLPDSPRDADDGLPKLAVLFAMRQIVEDLHMLADGYEADMEPAQENSSRAAA